MKNKKIIIQNNFSEQNENENSDIYFKYKNNKIVVVKEGSDSSNKTDSTDINLSSESTNLSSESINLGLESINLSSESINLGSESTNLCSESINKNDILDTDIIDIKLLYGKEIYYYNMLEKFFQNQPDKEIKRMIDIINGSNIVSLRFLDWFVTRYCYLYKLSININTPHNKENNFNINISYKAQLKSYKKKYFDPFRRKKKFFFIIEKNNNKLIMLTTIGQLNFFRWAISNDIINYTELNYKNIIVKFNHVNTYFKKNKLILDEETSNDDSKDSKKNNVPSVLRNIILEL
jgi:hypothetical protein